MTLELEALRQRIEAAEDEAGSISDCLDRGQSSSLRMPNPRAHIEDLMQLAKDLKQELHSLLAECRSTNPQSVEAWINLHVEALRRIADEPQGDAVAETRKQVARRTVEDWERVRKVEKSYVATNWSYLADHQKAMQRLLPTQHPTVEVATPWWKFW
jgi:uncharacterized protein Yka (UPF0111/DUF47 family)